jgi:hypothetical protein
MEDEIVVGMVTVLKIDGTGNRMGIMLSVFRTVNQTQI